MGWNEPSTKRYEASAYTKVGEYTDAEDLFNSIRRALDDDTPYAFEARNEFYKYSDEKVYQVTIIIEEV